MLSWLEIDTRAAAFAASVSVSGSEVACGRGARNIRASGSIVARQKMPMPM